MPSTLAVITLSFDPIARVAGLAVRLETIALAATLVLTLLVAAWIARRVPATAMDDAQPSPGGRVERGLGAGSGHGRLRLDDLLFVVLGALPGAVVGGRLGYVLLHLDFYRANPGAIVDPGTGGLQLSLAIVGGMASGAVIGGLLDGPVGRWLHVAAMPLLLGLGLGKAAGLLGGTGQGLPSDAPWAVAYAGPGPWASLGPDVPSHPAQAYEAAGTGVVLLVVLALGVAGWFRARDGRAFFVALALWTVVRFGVAFTWRDTPVVGPLVADQLLSIVVLAIALSGVALAPRLLRRDAARVARRPVEPGPAWPDPATRPPF